MLLRLVELVELKFLLHPPRKNCKFKNYQKFEKALAIKHLIFIDNLVMFYLCLVIFSENLFQMKYETL